MKAKSTNKFLSVALALFMLLMSVPFSMFATTVRAEETAKDGVYVLNADDLTVGTYKDETAKAGTNDYFTINYGDKGTVAAEKPATDSEAFLPKYPFSDGSTFEKNLNFGGGTNSSNLKAGKRAIEFTAAEKGQVKIWWGTSNDKRGIKLVDEEKADVAYTEQQSKGTYVSTLKFSKAGKYYLVCPDGTCFFYKVEVTEIPDPKEYTLNADDLTVGTYKDQTAKAGTDGYFTLNYGDKGTVAAEKPATDSEAFLPKYPFSDGSTFEKNLNFGGGTNSSNLKAGKRAIEFTAAEKGQVKLWWGTGNDNRGIKLVDEEKADVDYTEQQKKGTYVSTLKFDKAGKYYLICPDGTCFFYKVIVTEGVVTEVEKAPWDEIAAPEITKVEQSKDEDGKLKKEIKVTVKATFEEDDKLTVTMLDKDGNVLETQSSTNNSKDTHELTFKKAETSGTYTFKAELTREGEDAKKAEKDGIVDFLLPLGKPIIISATSKGNGTVEVIWGKVDEAVEYEVFVGSESKSTAKGTTYMVEGLEVGKEYSITVVAKRGDENSETSAAVKVTTTQEAQRTWGFTYYGSSVDDSGENDGYKGSALDDKVTVFSTGGKGKVATSGGDSIPFYFTSVPTDKNFTFRVNVHIDSWTRDGDQQGFGILAIDSIPDAPTKSTFLSNQYMVVVSKMEYWWDKEKQEVDPNKLTTSGKYEYRVGAGVNARIDDGSNTYPVVQYRLDNAPEKGIEPGKYNILGNCKDYKALEDEGIKTISKITDFVFEIQKNNTGYFCTYYDKDGKTIIGQQKFYDPDALSKLDKDNVYVGLFAARNATATFTNIKLTTIDPKDDAPAEEKPIEKIQPVLTVGSSSSVANSDKYTLLIKSNVAGTAEVKLAGKTVATGLKLTGEDKYTEQVVTIAAGTNKIEVIFTPDADQELPEGTELSSTDPVTKTISVNYNTYFANQKNLYVSPKGTKGGNGGKEYPLDIYTAVSVVQPGQTIILMEGTYKLTKQVLIERGMDGTAENPINMIADPEAKTRPVLDFGGTKSGLKTGGNYWYFQGFDVTNAGQKTPGFIVGGNNITVDNVNAYNNTDTGIYIKAFRDSNDPRDYWPSNNLILNCTSHNNSDASFADADGFACKLTTGEGNVFDGCVAYNNADDGWDLYAKLASGPISPVTVQNCVAYGNGYLEDGTNAGNGNGFKLGGENLSGKHKIINSVAFNNKANGITSNSCPNIIIENCTSFNNGYEKDTKDVNVTVYTNVAGDTNFSISGIISFRDDKVKDINDSLKPQGTQTVASLYADNNYYWLDGKSANKSGAEVTKDMFESLEFKGSIARNADNTINMEGFLVLKDNAPKDAGARISGTPSKEFTVTPDDELPPPTGFEVTLIVVVIAISAAVAIVLFRKRKSSK